MPGSSAQLSIIVQLVDKASAAMQGVASNFKSANAMISKDAVDASNKFALGLAGATAALGGFVGYGAKVAADLQTAEIGLTTLLGSAEDAARTVQRIKVEAARTPFELVGLTQATQLLASVTHDGDKALNVVLDIGEGLAAMGKGQAELDRIIVNLQQVAAIGHASMVDIKQFAYAGIPIFEMLQQQTGLAGEALAQFISDGQVSFEMLTGMFDQANDAGGRFFNAYENQSGSFNQSLSNLKDSFGIFLATVVETTGIFDILTVAMQRATQFLDTHKETIVGAVEWLKQHQWAIYVVAGAITGALVPAIWAAVVAFGAAAIALAPFIIGGAIIGGIVAGALWIVKHWDLIEEKLASLKNWFVSTWNDIVSEVQLAAGKIMGFLQPIINTISTVINSASSLARVVSGGLPAAAGMLATGVLHTVIPKFAAGGIVTGPTLGLIGEAGPEAVIPLSKLGSVGGGITINNTITGNNISSSLDVRTLAAAVSDEIVRTLRMNQRVSV